MVILLIPAEALGRKSAGNVCLRRRGANKEHSAVDLERSRRGQGHLGPLPWLIEVDFLFPWKVLRSIRKDVRGLMETAA